MGTAHVNIAGQGFFFTPFRYGEDYEVRTIWQDFSGLIYTVPLVFVVGFFIHNVSPTVVHNEMIFWVGIESMYHKVLIVSIAIWREAIRHFQDSRLTESNSAINWTAIFIGNNDGIDS